MIFGSCCWGLAWSGVERVVRLWWQCGGGGLWLLSDFTYGEL